jgi:hypothetical protein
MYLIIILIWRALFWANELTSTFLNDAVREIEKLNVTNHKQKSKILKKISYSKDFIYTMSLFFSPYAMPNLLRIRLPRSLRRNKLVLISFEKRMQFIYNRLNELTPIIALSKNKEELKPIADELNRFSTAIRKENYLSLEEAKLNRSYLSDLLDWKMLFTGIILTIVAWLLR